MPKRSHIAIIIAERKYFIMFKKLLEQQLISLNKCYDSMTKNRVNNKMAVIVNF